MKRRPIVYTLRSAPAPVVAPRPLRGLSAEGPGFYVWDEDPGEAVRTASELVRLARSQATTPPPDVDED